MRRVVWTAWAYVFGLMFATIFVTKFTTMFSRQGAPIVWLVLTAVGCVACLKLARQGSASET